VISNTYYHVDMSTFGQKLTTCRKAKNLSQKELAKLFVTSSTTIGKYERDEMIPSIEAAKKLAEILDTTVGYLIGETEKDNLLKDPVMLKRLQDIANLPEPDRESLLLTIDNFIKATKLKAL